MRGGAAVPIDGDRRGGGAGLDCAGIERADVSTAPRFDIDLPAFWNDPYPALAGMRAKAPVAFVPQLNSTLFCSRDLKAPPGE